MSQSIGIKSSPTGPFVYVENVVGESLAFGSDNTAQMFVLNTSASPNVVPNSVTANINFDPTTNGNITFLPNGTGNSVFASGDVSISLGNLDLPATTAGFTGGTIKLNSIPFVQGYGVDNTFIGLNAGNSTLSTGDAQFNNALGTSALNGLTLGQGNDAIGYQAGLVLNIGSDNQFFGFQAGGGLTDGVANVFIGFQSGINIVDGGYTVAIGYQSGINNTGSDSSNIYINNVGSSGESNTTRIGTPGASFGQQDSCYIAGIASVAVSNKNYVTIDTTTGQMGSDSGPSTNITITGDTGGPLTGNSFTFSGGTTGLSFDGSGTTETLSITNLNLPATNSALTAGCITSAGSTIFQAYPNGAQNLFIGLNSGNGTLSSANGNFSLGYNCLSQIDTSSGNECIGLGAGASLVSGNFNHLFGLECGSSLVDGFYNTLVGQQAGVFVVSGNYNVMIGAYQTGVNCTGSETSNLYIQNPGVTSESNTIRIGDQGTGNAQQNACYIAGIFGTSLSGSPVVVTSSGQLGVGSGNVVSSAFLAYLSGDQANVTGDGTNYHVAFDSTTFNIGSNFNTGTGIFTAPNTGIYNFCVTVYIYNILVAVTYTSEIMSLVTTSQTYNLSVGNPGNFKRTSNNDCAFSGSVYVSMTAGDTAFVNMNVSGGSKIIGVGGGVNGTIFSGNFIG